MKIGILTFHNAYNAGAVLQAFALQSFLSSLGHDVEVLNYRNKKIDERYRVFIYCSMPKRHPIKLFKYLVNQSYRKIKYLIFQRDVKRFLHISNRIRNFEDLLRDKKDLIVIGSDQLWNKSLTGINDSFYWAEFSPILGIKTITYAICMNTDNVSDDDVKYIKNNISNYSAVSVRESDLAVFLSTLTNIKIHVSLDPTLMVNREIWTQMLDVNKRPTVSKYLCVYAILDRNAVVEEAKRMAQSKNLQLIIMEPIADVNFFDNRYKPATLMGFISAIANAEYVVTSSFHGLAFSVIFHKEVFVFGDSGKNERMKSLLGSLGILNHFISSGNLPGQRIDYNDVETKLARLRKDSQQYLKELI